jgi:hypothetical protein
MNEWINGERKKVGYELMYYKANMSSKSHKDKSKATFQNTVYVKYMSNSAQ